MKKRLFTFLFSSITCLCYSQVNFGIKSGINIATTKDLIAFPKNRVGWYAGAFAKIRIHKKFFLQPELLFSSKGYRYDNYTTNSTTSIRFNYVTIPFLFGKYCESKIKLFK